MGNACHANITITNQLLKDLTRNNYHLSNGKWEKEPEMTITQGESINVVAISKTCEMVGTEGTIKYGLSDGTAFNIFFTVPYGKSENELNCSPEGSMANKYDVKIDPDFSKSGLEPKGTITISLKPK